MAEAIESPYAKTSVMGGLKDIDVLNAYPEHFIAVRPNLKLVKRGENRKIADYDPVKKYYVELTDTDACDIIINDFTESNRLNLRKQTTVKESLATIKSLLASKLDRVVDGETVGEYNNFLNGVFDIKTRTMKEHSPEFFTTSLTNYEVNFNQKDMPIFSGYLDKVTQGNDSFRMLIQEMFGYCLFDGKNMQRVFFLYSKTGGTGKSTMQEILSTLIGKENTSSLSFEQIASGKSMLIAAVGKRLNFSSEIGTKYVDNSVISSLITGEEVSFDVKYQAPMKTRFNKLRFVFSTNALPNFNSLGGMERRTIILPFTHVFDKTSLAEVAEGEVMSPVERDIAERILDQEAGAIINWAIEGYDRLHKSNKFTTCDVSVDIANEYKKSIDSFSAYMSDYQAIYDATFGEWQKSIDFYGKPGGGDAQPTGYVKYCKDNGFRAPQNSRRFAMDLAEHVENHMVSYEKRISRGNNEYRLSPKRVNEINKEFNEF